MIITPRCMGILVKAAFIAASALTFIPLPGIEKFKAFMDEAADLVLRFGGSLSGEHGDGQARGEYLPKMFGHELYQAFREFKAIWDPHGKMNPGKKIDAYGVAENLRIGAGLQSSSACNAFPVPQRSQFLRRAALRCVGVGECRREDGQVMCPSYQVTREEKDSTRGRAHLLFEMMNGEVLTDGWKSEAVKDALDLCLACKGCKGDCPGQCRHGDLQGRVPLALL